jgi:hypothetical protein
VELLLTKKAYHLVSLSLKSIFKLNKTITAYLSIGIFHDGRDVFVQNSFYIFSAAIIIIKLNSAISFTIKLILLSKI